MASEIAVDDPVAGVARLTLDTPGRSVNILSRRLLADLGEALDRLEARSDLAGLIVVSGKPGTFVAGADLTDFVRKLDAPAEEVAAMSEAGQALFRRLSRLPCVTVCAIDGVCVGGGTEMASWCDRRIVTDRESTSIAFPEVKLGILPGWGGTVRMPRLVGLGNSVELISGGEAIDAAKARAMGWADDLIPAGDDPIAALTEAAVRLIARERQSRRYEADRERRSGPVPMSMTEASFLALTAQAVLAQKTKGQYTAPGVALETTLEGALADEEEALAGERAALASLWGQPENRALLNVFFLTDHNKKAHRDEAVGGKAVRRVGVLGAGLMGAGIAGAAVRRGLDVTLVDANEAALAKGMTSALTDATFDKALKGPDPKKFAEAVPRLRTATGPSAVAGSDVVVEAIVEKFDAKQALYRDLADALGPETILATNTSSLPIDRLATAVPDPARFVGLHFFNPVSRMQLVEVIRGKATSGATVAAAVGLARTLKKMPIVVGDGPGFLVNRLLFPYMNEAIACLEEGYDPVTIDRAAKRFGMPMGPFELYDLVGLDTAASAGATMAEAFPDRYAVNTILPGLVGAGRLGQKSGRGFYSYAGKKAKRTVDPELVPLLKTWMATEGRDADGGATPPDLSPDELATRLILPMLVEATRVLEAGLVEDVRDVDLGVIFGLGFPPFRGGLLFWADTLGAKTVFELLTHWKHLGPRFEPTATMRDLAATGGTYYHRDEPSEEAAS